MNRAHAALHPSALGADIFTKDDDLDSLRSMFKDAVAHFDVAERPAVIRIRWMRDELIAAG